MLGKNNVAALLGGWSRWKEAKLPTQSNLKPQPAVKK